MIDHTTEPTPRSPLDPYLESFLHEVQTMADGFAPASHGGKVAAALDWPPAFAEALFTSARARGLLEPYRARGMRGRTRWHLSARGRRWLEIDES
jgi:hypothetical protein